MMSLSSSSATPATSTIEALAHKLLDYAKIGQWEELEYALKQEDARALVNSMPKGRWALLHQASFFGCTTAVRMLLDRKADPRLENRDGDTAVAIAQRQGYANVAALLARCAEVVTPNAVEQLLALAMACHPRLGHGSAANCLQNASLRKIFEFLYEVPPVVLQCNSCSFRLAGFRCQGRRLAELQIRVTHQAGQHYPTVALMPGVTLPVVPSGCGCTLKVSADGELSCPRGHGAGELHCLGHGQLLPSVIPAPAGIADAVEETGVDESPLLTCNRCGWSVDGALCVSEAHEDPLPLPRNGFFERCFCAYVWSCQHGCSRKPDDGGLFTRGSLTCRCGGEMHAFDYEERHGPPAN